MIVAAFDHIAEYTFLTLNTFINVGTFHIQVKPHHDYFQYRITGNDIPWFSNAFSRLSFSSLVSTYTSRVPTYYIFYPYDFPRIK